jgi:hypothetical protein
MLVPINWRDEDTLFERVAEALECGDGFTTIARDERSPYGENGYIVIKSADGRRFHLSISEEH